MSLDYVVKKSDTPEEDRGGVGGCLEGSKRVLPEALLDFGVQFSGALLDSGVQLTGALLQLGIETPEVAGKQIAKIGSIRCVPQR